MHLREKDREGQNRESPVPLVEATVEFVKAFSARTTEEGASLVNGRGKMNGYAKGRGNGKGKEREWGGGWEEWGAESFLPSYVFDAMKENKRFDFMRVGLSSLMKNYFDAYMCCRMVNRKMRKSSSGSTLTPSKKSCSHFIKRWPLHLHLPNRLVVGRS